MKKQILSLLVLILSVSATVVAKEKKDPRGPEVKQVKIKEAFHTLVAKGNVDVILFEDTISCITVIGKQKQAVRIKEENGVLTIESKRAFGKRIQVTVPVKHLCFITAGEFSNISTVTTLQSPELTIAMNDGSKAAVRNAGIINIVNGIDTEDCFLVDETEKVFEESAVINIVNGTDTADYLLVSETDKPVVESNNTVNIVNGKDTKDCQLVL